MRSSKLHSLYELTHLDLSNIYNVDITIALNYAASRHPFHLLNPESNLQPHNRVARIWEAMRGPHVPSIYILDAITIRAEHPLRLEHRFPLEAKVERRNRPSSAFSTYHIPERALLTKPSMTLIPGGQGSLLKVQFVILILRRTPLARLHALLRADKLQNIPRYHLTLQINGSAVRLLFCFPGFHFSSSSA